MTPYLVGGGLALAVCGLLGSLARLDRDRAFYTTVTMVVATYYILFAAMANAREALIVESAIAALFMAASVFGFHRNMWIVAAALFGHGVFDVFHGAIVHNPGLPAWWPAFCMAFDVVGGAWVGVLLATRRAVPERRLAA